MQTEPASDRSMRKQNPLGGTYLHLPIDRSFTFIQLLFSLPIVITALKEKHRPIDRKMPGTCSGCYT